MQPSKLVRSNVERVILSEAASSDAAENQLYVHIKPVLVQIPASIFLRYWKPVSLASLSVSLCYALLFRPAFLPSTEEISEISLASLIASENIEELNSAANDSGTDSATTAIVYSGSEYQNRLETEYNSKNVPAVVQDPQTSSQIIDDFEARKQSFLLRKQELLRKIVPGNSPEDLKGMVKFIAGLIAVNRPNIPDCGAVAAAIVKLSANKKVDPFFVAALISVESRFGQNEKSHVGATGLMQLMPNTALEVADSSKTIKPSLTDITTNIRLGIDYWKQLEKKYHGNRFLALSAYNWGPGNVDKVRTTPTRIPASVQKYAKTILERHASWLTHFRNAKAGASNVG